MTAAEWQQYLSEKAVLPYLSELPVPGDAVVAEDCPKSSFKTDGRVSQKQTAWP